MSDKQNEFLFHPKNIMMAFSLFGLCAMFLSLTISYVYTRVTMGGEAIQVPWIFLVNTGVLLYSSWTMIQARKSYQNDDTSGYLTLLKRTIYLSTLFMILQGVGWYLLFQNNITLQSSNGSGYLYVISILHLVHVVGGLPFLIYFYKKAKKSMIDPVTVGVYFSDPGRRLSLRLLTVYWHFLDLLWIYLVLFFLINSLI